MSWRLRALAAAAALLLGGSQPASIIKWYGGEDRVGAASPFVPVNRRCVAEAAGGGAGGPTWRLSNVSLVGQAVPLHVLVAGPREYWVLGLHTRSAATGQLALAAEVFTSADGGSSWACRDDRDADALLRAGSAAFALTPPPAPGARATMCVAGGRSFAPPAFDPGGAPQPGPPLASVRCIVASGEWLPAAPLPAPVVGAQHERVPLADGTWRHLLAGGQRQDGSDDLWLAVLAREPAAGGVGWLPERWLRLPLSQPLRTRLRPLVTWMPRLQLLAVAGGSISFVARRRALNDDEPLRTGAGGASHHHSAAGWDEPAVAEAPPARQPPPQPSSRRSREQPSRAPARRLSTVVVDTHSGEVVDEGIDTYAVVDMLALNVTAAIVAAETGGGGAGGGNGSAVPVGVEKLPFLLPRVREQLPGIAYSLHARYPVNPTLEGDVLIFHAGSQVYSGIVGFGPDASNFGLAERRHQTYRGAGSTELVLYDDEAPATTLSVPAYDDAQFSHWLSVSSTNGRLFRGSMEGCDVPECGDSGFASPCASSPFDARCANCTVCAAGVSFAAAFCRPSNPLRGLLGKDTTCQLCEPCPDGSQVVLGCGLPGNPFPNQPLCALSDPDGIKWSSARASLFTLPQLAALRIALYACLVASVLLLLPQLPALAHQVASAWRTSDALAACASLAPASMAAGAAPSHSSSSSSSSSGEGDAMSSDRAWLSSSGGHGSAQRGGVDSSDALPGLGAPTRLSVSLGLALDSGGWAPPPPRHWRAAACWAYALMASLGPVSQVLTTMLSVALFGGCCGSLLERQAIALAANQRSTDFISGGFLASDAPALVAVYRPLQTDEFVVAALGVFLLLVAPILHSLVLLAGWCFVPALGTAATLGRVVTPSIALRERALVEYVHGGGGGGDGGVAGADAAAADPEVAAARSRGAPCGDRPRHARDSMFAYALVSLRALTLLAGMWRPRLLLACVASPHDGTRVTPQQLLLRWMTLGSALLCELPLLLISVALLIFGRGIAPATSEGPGSALQQASMILPGVAFALQLWHVIDSLSALASMTRSSSSSGGSRLFGTAGPGTHVKSGSLLPGAAHEQDVSIRGGWAGVGAAAASARAGDGVSGSTPTGRVERDRHGSDRPRAGQSARSRGVIDPAASAGARRAAVSARAPPHTAADRAGRAGSVDGDGASLVADGDATASTLSPVAAVMLISELWVRAATPEARRLAGMRTFFRRHPHLLPDALAAVSQVPLPAVWHRLLDSIEAQMEEQSSGADAYAYARSTAASEGAALSAGTASDASAGVATSPAIGSGASVSGSEPDVSGDASRGCEAAEEPAAATREGLPAWSALTPAPELELGAGSSALLASLPAAVTAPSGEPAGPSAPGSPRRPLTPSSALTAADAPESGTHRAGAEASRSLRVSRAARRVPP